MVIKATVIMPFAEFFTPYKWRGYPALQLLHKHLKDIGVTSNIIDMNEEFRKNIGHIISNNCNMSDKLSKSLITMIEKDPKNIFHNESIYREVIKPFSSFSDPETHIENNTDDITKKIQSPAGKMMQTFTDYVIARNKSDLYLITLPSHHHSVSASILGSVIKKHYKDAHVTFGGAYMTIIGNDAAMEFVKKGFCDTIVIGNGEPKITELVKRLGSNPKGEILCEKDIDVNLQITSTPDSNDFTHIIFSRGCPWGKCAFCNYTAANDKYSIKKIDVLLDEIETLMRDHKKHRFNLVGETLPPEYARRLSRAIIHNGWKIKWRFQFMRVDKGFDSATLKQMKNSGCDFSQTFVGIDVISEKGLKYANKGYSKDDIKWLLGEAEKAGVILGSVAWIYDFPGTSFDDASEAIRILERYISSYHTVKPGKFILLKKSEMGKHPKRYGLEVTEDMKNDKSPLRWFFEFRDKNRMSDKELKIINKKLRHIQITIAAFQRYGNLDKRKFNDIKLYNPERESIRVRIPNHSEIIHRQSGDVHIHNPYVVIDDNVIQSQYFLSRVKPGKWYSIEKISSECGKEDFINLQKTFRLVRELLAIGYFSEVELTHK